MVIPSAAAGSRTSGDPLYFLLTRRATALPRPNKPRSAATGTHYRPPSDPVIPGDVTRPPPSPVCGSAGSQAPLPFPNLLPLTVVNLGHQRVRGCGGTAATGSYGGPCCAAQVDGGEEGQPPCPERSSPPASGSAINPSAGPTGCVSPSYLPLLLVTIGHPSPAGSLHHLHGGWVRRRPADSPENTTTSRKEGLHPQPPRDSPGALVQCG
ncbi:hypothetical protein ACQJBY_001347 [Aegilops geniculata]